MYDIIIAEDIANIMKPNVDAGLINWDPMPIRIVIGIHHFFWTTNVSLRLILLFPARLRWSGVAIFFAISGFCIHSSYTRERHLGVTRYLIKRTFRIYPPYFISLCFFSFWLATYGHGVLLPNLLLHVLLIHNFAADYFYGINLAYWSIAVEFQLYVLYIPLIYIKEKFGWKATITLAFLLESCIRSVEAYELMRFGEISIWVAGCPFIYIFSWSIGALVAERKLCETLKSGNKPLPHRRCSVGKAIPSA